MEPKNLLFILSDQHNRRVSGCYGHPIVQTPHIDRLAEQGARFTNAYTPSPICVPARAALATGRHVYETGYWDNGTPYDGRVPSWGHRLKANGFRVDSIGKLHFRGQQDDNGFTEEIDGLYVVDGIGDVTGALRDDPVFRNARPGVEEAGSGDSTYLQYDARNATNARKWLQQHQNDEKPWVLFLSFVLPHPPYIAPEKFFEQYPLDSVVMPPQWREADWPNHPTLQYFREYFNFRQPFTEETIRRLIAAYYGMCTYLDEQIGTVLETLDSSGLSDHTRIIYTSDHGESLGGRGLFGKFTMYEESAGIPMILAGADVPAGKVVNTPVSLIDCYPTILEAVGCPMDADDHDLPGESLWQIAQDDDRERAVFSEYHAVGSQNAYFMLRNNRYKYVYHVGAPPQLFDLETDPDELNDLGQSPDHSEIRSDFERQLRAMLDPEAVNARAKADQQAMVAANGGRETLLQRGAFQNSPVPGEQPKFVRGNRES